MRLWRSKRFLSALDQAASTIQVDDPPMWERSDDDPVLQFACDGTGLDGISVETTARTWVIHLAWMMDAQASILRLGYFSSVSIQLFEEGESDPKELVPPPVPVYLAMLRDLVGSIRLAGDPPTGALELKLREQCVRFDCMVEKCEAVWINAGYSVGDCP